MAKIYMLPSQGTITSANHGVYFWETFEPWDGVDHSRLKSKLVESLNRKPNRVERRLLKKNKARN